MVGEMVSGMVNWREYRVRYFSRRTKHLFNVSKHFCFTIENPSKNFESNAVRCCCRSRWVVVIFFRSPYFLFAQNILLGMSILDLF